MKNSLINSVFDCNFITLDKEPMLKGLSSSLEVEESLPFSIARIYYLYDVPSGSERGGHAHYHLQQFLVAASGSFEVVLKDGSSTKRVTLNRPNHALHIVPGIWRELSDFSSGATCLVFASHAYDESDYIRDYDDFLKHKSAR